MSEGKLTRALHLCFGICSSGGTVGHQHHLQILTISKHFTTSFTKVGFNSYCKPWRWWGKRLTKNLANSVLKPKDRSESPRLHSLRFLSFHTIRMLSWKEFKLTICIFPQIFFNMILWGLQGSVLTTEPRALHMVSRRVTIMWSPPLTQYFFNM